MLGPCYWTDIFECIGRPNSFGSTMTVPKLPAVYGFIWLDITPFYWSLFKKNWLKSEPPGPIPITAASCCCLLLLGFALYMNWFYDWPIFEFDSWKLLPANWFRPLVLVPPYDPVKFFVDLWLPYTVSLIAAVFFYYELAYSWSLNAWTSLPYETVISVLPTKFVGILSWVLKATWLPLSWCDLTAVSFRAVATS